MLVSLLCLGLHKGMTAEQSCQVAMFYLQFSCIFALYFDKSDAYYILFAEVLDPIKESHLEFFQSRSKLTEALGTSPQVGSSS